MCRKNPSKILSLTLALCLILSSFCGALSVYADTVADGYASGSGTRTDPYIIATVGQLQKLDADTVAGVTAGKYYKLDADLSVENLCIGQNRKADDFKATTTGGNYLPAADEYLPTAIPFEGVFDGNNHTITYTYNAAYALGGMFSGLKNATVKNLTVKGEANDPRINFGSIAAFASDSVIENCISEVNVVHAGMWSAGIVGVAYNSAIRNTENRGDITHSRRYPAKTTYQNLQTYVNSTYNTTNTGLYDWTHCAIAGIVSMVVGNMEFTNVLNSGDVTNGYVSDFTETAGVVAIVKNAGSTYHNVTFNSVGNTGDIKATRVNNNNDRIGGVYGIIENATYTFNKIWSTGTITPVKDASGNFNKTNTGVIGGGLGGSIKRAGKIIAYGSLGKIEGYTQSDSNVRTEFFGKQNNFGDANTCTIYYDGNAYTPVNTDVTLKKLDLKSAEFAELLGSEWQATENGYPTLKHITSSGYASGTGTEADPYIIATVNQLKQLDEDTVAGITAGKYYKLVENLEVINLSIGQNREVKYANKAGKESCEPIPDAKPFEGVFDGNYHTINYTYDLPYALGGLFAGLNNATVKNLNLKGMAANTGVNFGSIAAFAYYSTIDNCLSEINVDDARQWSAGIVGVAVSCVIKNTENRGNVTAWGSNAYNVANYMNSYILATYGIDSSVLTYADTHRAWAGVIAVAAGYMELTNVLNTGDITSHTGYFTETGGIIGVIKNPTEDGYLNLTSVGNTGTIKSLRIVAEGGLAHDRIGGIFGQYENGYFTFNKIWSTGDIIAAKYTADGTNAGNAGVIGGAMSGASEGKMMGKSIIYGRVGALQGFDPTPSNGYCLDEFFKYTGAINSTNSEIYYSGGAYQPTGNVYYRDMKYNENFATELGDGWRANPVEGGYPILASHFNQGDFDNDGSVTIVDLVSAKKYIAGAQTKTNVVPSSCDFNEDYKFDTTDLVSLVKVILNVSIEPAPDSDFISVYSHNVCSHGDETDISEDAKMNRYRNIRKVINTTAPNVLVLTECGSGWARGLSNESGYAIAPNPREGWSDIQILYNDKEFTLIENNVHNVDAETRSEYHWAILESKKTGKRFLVYGYHGTVIGESYDWVLQKRTAEIQAMLAVAAEKNLPAILAGDFNTTRDSSEYNLTTAAFDNVVLTAETKLDAPTSLGWDIDNVGESITRDHVLYSKNKGLKATSGVVFSRGKNGIVLSDHCAVFAEFILK